MLSTLATKPSARKRKFMCQPIKGVLVVIPKLCLDIALTTLNFCSQPSKNLSYTNTIMKRKNMILVKVCRKKAEKNEIVIIISIENIVFRSKIRRLRKYSGFCVL
jgi:hypothetical protein